MIGALIGLAALPASAQEAEEFNVRRAVLSEAFDPDTLFQSAYRTEPILTIRYLGDDWGYPVYALALFKGCHSDDLENDEACRHRLQARMIRAPYDGEPERPRWRGAALLGSLEQARVNSREKLLAALDDGAVEWLEADLAQCASATEYLRENHDVSWFGETPVIAEPDDILRLIIHYDTIDVHYRPTYYSEFNYSGHVDEKLPSGWADGFAKSLEACWAPSSAPPPWRRLALTTEDQQ